jgi:hypothetical protein
MTRRAGSSSRRIPGTTSSALRRIEVNRQKRRSNEGHLDRSTTRLSRSSDCSRRTRTTCARRRRSCSPHGAVGRRRGTRLGPGRGRQTLPKGVRSSTAWPMRSAARRGSRSSSGTSSRGWRRLGPRSVEPLIVDGRNLLDGRDASRRFAYEGSAGRRVDRRAAADARARSPSRGSNSTWGDHLAVARRAARRCRGRAAEASSGGGQAARRSPGWPPREYRRGARDPPCAAGQGRPVESALTGLGPGDRLPRNGAPRSRRRDQFAARERRGAGTCSRSPAT